MITSKNASIAFGVAFVLAGLLGFVPNPLRRPLFFSLRCVPNQWPSAGFSYHPNGTLQSPCCSL